MVYLFQSACKKGHNKPKAVTFCPVLPVLQVEIPVRLRTMFCGINLCEPKSMQNFPNNIVPTSLYCNKYYTRCAAACQCASDGRSLTGQSTVPSTRVWRITSATRKTLWRLRVAATPSSATMGPRERSSGHHFCGGAAETDGTVHRSLSCTSDIKATPISQKAEWPAGTPLFIVLFADTPYLPA